MARKKVVSETAAKLAKALTFVSQGVAEGSDVWKAHGRIINGYFITFNGILAAGYPVDEELKSCPHVPMLSEVIARAGKTLSMAENDKGNLQVNGENVRVTVPCLKPQDMPPIMPDVRVADVNDAIKEGFKALVPLCSEDEDGRVHVISILLRANTMVATNGSVIFEYWHGIDLPPGLNIMRASAKAVAAVAESLEGFGWTPGRTVTFWFEGGAFMQMALAAGEWPEVDGILNAPGKPSDLPAGLFEGIEVAAKFSADGAVHFFDDKVKSSYANYDAEGAMYGATYDVPGLVGKHSFTVRHMKLIKPVCDKLDYTTNEDRATFVGPIATGEEFARVRGVIMKRG